MRIVNLNKEALGWNEFFENSFQPYAQQGMIVGRVYSQDRLGSLIYTDTGEVHAEVSGRLRYLAESRADYPAVGDWVALTPPTPTSQALIEAVLPRKSKFSRKVAGAKTEEQIVVANIDWIFLVSGLDQDFNVRRIERFLTLVRESGAQPLIVLNKADKCADRDQRLREVGAVAICVPIVCISAKQGAGLGALEPFLKKGETISVLGSSGVGKSTLVNRLLGQDLQRTQDVRDGDDRGKHTTRRRELMMLPSGAIMIDTPGMRELQLWATGEGIRETFEDIQTIAEDCYFRDCRHESEPSCAVLSALQNGTLDPSRFSSYRQLQSEIQLLEVRQNHRAQAVERQRVKRLTQIPKQKRKGW